MDNFEYLNQISQSNRPVKVHHQGSKFKTGLVIKLAIGGLVLFFLLMALGSLLGNIGKKSDDLTKQLYVRTVNLNSTLSTYNSVLKSSKLRAIGTSLAAILTNTSNQLSSYLTAENSDKKTALVPSEKITTSEAQIAEELNVSLNNAKLNGILDRAYDNQIGLQVSLLLSQVSGLLARTKDPQLTEILTTFYSSLETIHQSIEAYSSN